MNQTLQRRLDRLEARHGDERCPHCGGRRVTCWIDLVRLEHAGETWCHCAGLGLALAQLEGSADNDHA